jgi:hypothetical protein
MPFQERREAPMPESAGWEAVREIARSLPGVEEGTSYETPALRVRRHLFARLKEDGETLVLRVNPYERPYLLEAEPELFFLTDHYRDYPFVLLRLARVSPERLRQAVEEAWRLAAPKRLVDDYDARSGSPGWLL